MPKYERIRAESTHLYTSHQAKRFYLQWIESWVVQNHQFVVHLAVITSYHVITSMSLPATIAQPSSAHLPNTNFSQAAHRRQTNFCDASALDHQHNSKQICVATPNIFLTPRLCGSGTAGKREPVTHKSQSKSDIKKDGAETRQGLQACHSCKGCPCLFGSVPTKAPLRYLVSRLYIIY